jgi:hypothetical protein
MSGWARMIGHSWIRQQRIQSSYLLLSQWSGGRNQNRRRHGPGAGDSDYCRNRSRLGAGAPHHEGRSHSGNAEASNQVDLVGIEPTTSSMT